MWAFACPMKVSITAKFNAAKKKTKKKKETTSEGLAGPKRGKNTLTCSAGYSSETRRFASHVEHRIVARNTLGKFSHCVNGNRVFVLCSFFRYT